MGENILILSHLTKTFGEIKAIDDLSLEVRRGEIFTLLGPSGCGKTTTLRQIAGLEAPSEGEITYKGRVITAPAKKVSVPTHKRNMGMVFQSYAIWPHFTVFETVAYPLRARRLSQGEISKRVMGVLELVGLAAVADRPGPKLSGGQQQRVALARALVYEPDLLLLDEPFSNLDVKLREQMRVELKILQRKIGVTSIFVTHDQTEALSVSDRIAVMNKGKIDQIASPLELYQNPTTQFVRDFIGTTVTFAAKFDGYGPNLEMKVTFNNGMPGYFWAKKRYAPDLNKGDAVEVTIRPEEVVVSKSDLPVKDGENALECVVEALLFVGNHYQCRAKASRGDAAVLVHVPPTQQLRESEKIRLYFPPEQLSVWKS